MLASIDTAVAIYNYTVDNLGRVTAVQELIAGLANIDLTFDDDSPRLTGFD